MTYTQENFDRLIDELWGQSGALMRSKGEEYASDADRLGNFRRIATTAGLTAERTALVLLAKHVDSLSQGVQKGAPFVWATEDGKEGMKQRLADLINYCFLLGATLEAAAVERDGERLVRGFSEPAPSSSTLPTERAFTAVTRRD